MNSIPFVPISDYDYDLPEALIAQKACEPRDCSKLLLYNKGEISTSEFRNLPEFLDSESILIFNNAKVIPARLFLKNANGANIEVFILHPKGTDHSGALSSDSTVVWECLIGNGKRWKKEEILKADIGTSVLKLERLDGNDVRFTWDSGQLFSELLELIGKIPLPPYIKHEADSTDALRYQTVYSKIPGSVAAPTAGLHFTEQVMQGLDEKGLQTMYLTLHVGAGTFMPVKVENAAEHPMHEEQFEIDRLLLENLKKGKKLIPVGTTSCRVLESIYHLAIHIKSGDKGLLRVPQFPYFEEFAAIDRLEVSDILKNYMDIHKLDVLKASTSIMIMPGYRFRMTDALITNFHQPGSTLLLLISALIGEDWRAVYEYAKGKAYRFLSYGDSSLLIPRDF